MPSERDESRVVRSGPTRHDYESGDGPEKEAAGRARVIREQKAAERTPVAKSAPVTERKPREPVAPPAAAPVAPVVEAPAVAAPGQAQAYNAASAAGAGQQMEHYDQYAKAAMGASPAEAMQLAQNAAQQMGQQQADAAIRQSVKGAKTAGAMGGQAALAGSAQAAGAYGQGVESGRQQYFDTTKLGATLGSEMSSRQARAAQTEAGVEATKSAAESSKYATDKAAKSAQPSGWDTFGKVLGAAGGVAALFSDRNLKEDIQPDRLTRGLEKIKGYAYRYKGSPRQESGVIAQDLEKTAMAPAVFETPKGKAIDTNRLSTMNTAALSDQEKRLKNIEKIIGALAEARGK